MLKLVAPASVLAVLLAHAVLAGSAGVEVRMGTSETVAAACRLAPGFQSARLWQKAPDEDIYVRDVLADARAVSGVRSAVARFKAELQDRALAEMIDKRRIGFVPGRLTLGGCATYAAVDAVDNSGTDAMFPALRVQ
jgi:hypothetical protein